MIALPAKIPVQDPLAKAILEGRFEEGGAILVDVNDQSRGMVFSRAAWADIKRARLRNQLKVKFLIIMEDRAVMRERKDFFRAHVQMGLYKPWMISDNQDKTIRFGESPRPGV